MKWFGESWGSVVCRSLPASPTPVGELCALCEVSIVEGDQGILLPYSSEGEKETEEPWHLKCLSKATVGIP
jgi:hypothetical protein